MMGLLAAGLGAIGRQGTRAVAASLFLGMALPQLAEAARPLLQVAVFALLTFAFMRLDFAAVRACIGRWRLLALTLMWMMALMPLAIGLALRLSGVAAEYPDFALAIYITTAPPPVMSVAAFAAIMRLDHALSITLLILSAVVTPVLAPFVAGLTLETALPLEPLSLAIRLGVILAGSFAAAMAVRRLVGLAAIERNRDAIDGSNVVILFIFAVAAMDGVALAFYERTGVALAMLACSFLVAFLQIGLTMAVAWRLDRIQSFTIALSSGIRNMGLFVAALGPAVPEFTWLYFGIGQFPIYLLPFLFRSVGGRLVSPRP